jgi:pilus assembly protein Flp/PilA
VIGQLLARFLRDESGPTAAEYAVLLALIIMVLMAAIGSVGNSTSAIWVNDVNKISSAVGS